MSIKFGELPVKLQAKLIQEISDSGFREIKKIDESSVACSLIPFDELASGMKFWQKVCFHKEWPEWYDDKVIDEKELFNNVFNVIKKL